MGPYLAGRVGQGTSAASLPNSSGKYARTVVVRTLPRDAKATASLVIASPSGISSTANRREVAPTLCRARPLRAARRAASGGAPQNRRCQGRKRRHADIGEPTAGSHALQHAQHGPTLWHLDVERRADLAGLWAAAAPPGDFQVVP